MALQESIERIVTGLGYDLVELERTAGGLLRVTIDWPWVPGTEERFVQVEDCERVTRQLQFALEVEGVDYKRLEVSSPGIDRPLRHEQDFARFVGERIELTLRQPMGAAAGQLVAANRKRFAGVVAPGAAAGEWQIQWQDLPERKPGQKLGKKAQAVPVQVLGFRLEELREARLAAVVDFKGRKPKVNL